MSSRQARREPGCGAYSTSEAEHSASVKPRVIYLSPTVCADWTFRAFIDRLRDTAEEFGIRVEEASEAWTSQECPECGSTDQTVREGDSLTCPCGFDGHADLTAFARRVASCVPTRTFGSRDVRDVPKTARLRTKADGTARAIRVGRPRMVGGTTRSREGKSQRSAHTPEYAPGLAESRLRWGRHSGQTPV